MDHQSKDYSSVETSTPQFNELRQNLEKLTSKPKPEDLKKPKGPASQEKRDNSASPTPENESKATSDRRKSWVLANSGLQTKPFEDQNPDLAESQQLDSDEKPKQNQEAPTQKSPPQDDSKVYKIKDNPFVRGSTPTKNQPEVKKSLTASREGVSTRRTLEERQVVKKTHEEHIHRYILF